MIQNASNVKAGNISGITVKDSFSFLNVPHDEAEMILKDFGKLKTRNKPEIQRTDKEKPGEKREAS